MYRNHEARCLLLREEKQILINEIRKLYSPVGLWVFYSNQDIIESKNTFRHVFYSNSLSQVSIKKLKLLLKKAKELYNE